MRGSAAAPDGGAAHGSRRSSHTFSTATTPIDAPTRASTVGTSGRTPPSTARASVALWPRVKPVTVAATARSEVAARSSIRTKST